MTVSRPLARSVALLVAGAVVAVAAPGSAWADPVVEATSEISIHQWQHLGPNGTGGELAFTRAKPARVYVSTQLGNVVFRSDDRGTTWNQADELPAQLYETAGIAASPVRPDLVLTGGRSRDDQRGKVLRSTDAAKSFSVVLDLPDNVNSVAISDNGARMYAAADSGVYSSSDDGTTWKLLPGSPARAQYARTNGSDLFFVAGPDVYVIKRASSNPQPAVKLASPGTNAGGIWGFTSSTGDTLVVKGSDTNAFSTDRGAHWKPLKGPWGTDVVTLFAGVNGSGVLRIQVNQATGEMQQWASRDNGRTWRSEPGLVKIDLYEATGNFTDRPTLDVVSAGAGIYTTTDHRTFKRIGVPGAQVLALSTAVGNQGPNLVAGTTTGTYQSTAPMKDRMPRGYQDWGPGNVAPYTMGNRIDSLATDPAHQNIVYRVRNTCSYTDPCFYLEKSTDAGSHWTIMQAEVPGKALSVAVSPKNPKKVYVATHSPAAIYTSEDGGKTFDPHYQSENVGFTSLALDPRNADSAWIGGAEGLYHTTSGGAGLDQVIEGWFQAVAMDPKNPNHIVAAGQDSFHVSWDNGKTWTKTASDLSGFNTGLAFGPDGTVYAASHDYVTPALGVLRSSDGGKTWTNITGTLPDPSVSSIAVSADGTWVYAGTTYGSVYRLRAGVN